MKIIVDKSSLAAFEFRRPLVTHEITIGKTEEGYYIDILAMDEVVEDFNSKEELINYLQYWYKDRYNEIMKLKIFQEK